MDVMSHSSAFLLPTIPADNCSSLTYALVVLNQGLPRFTPLLWKHAQLRLCADGGANRMYDEVPQMLPHEDVLDVRTRYKPDVIKGDMDSIRPEVLNFYSSLGTRVIDESHDQDTTDLHKCVAFIRDFTPNLEKSNLCILVAGALGGRFDHEAGNLNVLYRFSTMRIILLSDDCLIHLLPRTHRHEIFIHSSVEGPHCGLIPIGMPSESTTTTGLQWDLNLFVTKQLESKQQEPGPAGQQLSLINDGASSLFMGHYSLMDSTQYFHSFWADMKMKFGGLISTSNTVKEERITVQSDSDLLWTISIKK